MAATHTAHALHLFFLPASCFYYFPEFWPGHQTCLWGQGDAMLPVSDSHWCSFGSVVSPPPPVSLLAALISVGLPASCSSAPTLDGGGKRESQLDKCIYLGQ